MHELELGDSLREFGLIAGLDEQTDTRLVEGDPFRAGMSVTFGPEFMPIEGGLIGRRDGLVVLNLAPVPLDNVEVASDPPSP